MGSISNEGLQTVCIAETHLKMPAASQCGSYVRQITVTAPEGRAQQNQQKQNEQTGQQQGGGQQGQR